MNSLVLFCFDLGVLSWWSSNPEQRSSSSLIHPIRHKFAARAGLAFSCFRSVFGAQGEDGRARCLLTALQHRIISNRVRGGPSPRLTTIREPRRPLDCFGLWLYQRWLAFSCVARACWPISQSEKADCYHLALNTAAGQGSHSTIERETNVN